MYWDVLYLGRFVLGGFEGAPKILLRIKVHGTRKYRSAVSRVLAINNVELNLSS
jgi:hypothetical protein